MVREMLRALREGDVMLYADAGCSIVDGASEEWWSKVRALSEGRPIDAHQLGAANAAKIGCAVDNATWCRMDVVRAVLGSADDAAARFLASDQIEAGRLLILNCERARALVDAWCALALASPRLFTDEPSAVPNHPSFKEHQHDQSVFSALMWAHGLKGTAAWSCVPATQLRTSTMEWWARFQS